MISSLLSVAYLMPIVARAFFVTPASAPSGPSPIREAPAFCVVPLCLTALGCLVLFFCAEEIYRLLAPIAQP